MKIIYLTWGETPRSHGVYGSQVITQLGYTKNAIPDSQFLLVSGLPVIFSGLLREKFGYLEELRKIHHELGNINHKIIPIWAPQNFFYSREKEFNLFHLVSDWHLSKVAIDFLPDIIHCRSYHAAYAAIKAREYSGLKYKIIFDPRGIWPEESVLKGRTSYEDVNYTNAKKIEQYLRDNTDITVAVSDTMQKHYEAMEFEKCFTIYLSAPVEPTIPLQTSTATDIRDRKTTLCYVGALSSDTWHKPSVLFDLYRSYRKCVSNPHLLIVTQSNHKSILNQCDDIPHSEIELVSTYTSQELANCFQRSNFGALPYLIPATKCESLVAETVIGSKTAEYLTAGLPILVNKYCGGAREIIDKIGVGIVYDPETFIEISKENLEKLNNPSMSKIAIEFGIENFSYEKNAERYSNLYIQLTK
jgi:glycosyltransferase involved in cell wall biosynthesis